MTAVDPAAVALAHETGRVVRHLQHYTAEQRADLAASNHAVRNPNGVGAVFYTHPDLPGRSFDTRGTAARAAVAAASEPGPLSVINGPNPRSSTVTRCDVGGEPLPADASWWLVQGSGRGWECDRGAACAGHAGRVDPPAGAGPAPRDGYARYVEAAAERASGRVARRLVARRVPEVGSAVFDADTGEKVSPPGDAWWSNLRRARQELAGRRAAAALVAPAAAAPFVSGWGAL